MTISPRSLIAAARDIVFGLIVGAVSIVGVAQDIDDEGDE